MRRGGPIEKQRQRIAAIMSEIQALDLEHGRRKQVLEVQRAEAEAALAVMTGANKKKAAAELPLTQEKVA